MPLSAKFKANHYRRTPDEEIQGAAGMPPSNPHRRPREHRDHRYHHPKASGAHDLAAKEDERMDEDEFDEREGIRNRNRWETNVKEVWFAGVHCGLSLFAFGRELKLTTMKMSAEVQSRTTHPTHSRVFLSVG